MTISISLHILLALLGAIAFLIPFFVPERGGDYFRGMNIMFWMLACWPVSLILFAWAVVEAFR